VIEVLLADDQALVREGLRMMVEAEPDITVVGEVATGSDALAACRRLQPDVVLMDVRMPELDGIEATRRLTEGGSSSKVLILTTFDLDEYVYRAMKAGASGFLLKDATREQLVAAIRTVLGGEALLAPAITRRLIEDFCRRPEPSGDGPGATPLSTREREVVVLIARGLPTAAIAASLYLAEARVKAHDGRVLAKRDVRDRVQVAVFAYESGLVRPGLPD
jgi:DNA-binding NarL/FixJ family response regulator